MRIGVLYMYSNREKRITMTNEQITIIHEKAEVLYKEETGYTVKEHFHRTSTILTAREDRNAARRRYIEIWEEVEKDENKA